MLIGFKVSNFKSFKDLQYFSMVASKVRQNENHVVDTKKFKLLKLSAIFGANASGKTNLLQALSITPQILYHNINILFENLYFRGNEILKDKPSYFEYEILLNDKSYSYGIEINFSTHQILSEWLIDMTREKEKVIFERDIVNSNFITSIKEKKTAFNYCLEEMKSNNNILFLQEINRRIVMAKINTELAIELQSIFKFLTFDMLFIGPSSHKLLDLDYLKNKDKILNILKKLDIDISDIISIPSSMEEIKSKLPAIAFTNLQNDINLFLSSNKNKQLSLSLKINNDIYTILQNDNNYIVNILRFKHANSESTFCPYEESNGTIRVLELIDILLSKNKIFIIDELDSSLHPLLVKGLLDLFLNEGNNNQLIISTHDVTTMNYKNFRRDEIWFTQKNDNGETIIYSLEEFKDIARFDLKIDKAYMDGRFGGIPNIKIK